MNETILNKNNLNDINATFALGSLVGSELFRTGQAFIFFNIFGEVQLASKEDLDISPPLPIPYLDGLAVDSAIDILVQANVSDELICSYLAQRKERESATKVSENL